MNLNQTCKIDWLYNTETQKVFQALHKCGYEARIVGGAVRNAILGTPIKDIDFATNATPDQVISCAEKEKLHVIPTGLQHGTVTVVIDHHAFEITTLRKDIETDGRRAVVNFTDDWLEDAKRRDFTMNALYADQNGEVFDPLGGYQDLLEKRVRFIGTAEDRIREDYLRILRYFRFKAEYGLSTLDIPSLSACVKHRSGLRGLSAERIAAEMLRLLIAKDADAVLTLMFDYGLLVDILGCAPHFERLRTLIDLEQHLALPPNETRRLAALILMTEEDAERISQRLKLSNDMKRKLLLITGVIQNPKLYFLPSEDEAKILLYKLRPDDYRDHILAQWMLSKNSPDHGKWNTLYSLLENWAMPEFPIKGADLLQLGFKSGPDLGKILKKLEMTWLKANFSLTKKDLLLLIKNSIN